MKKLKLAIGNFCVTIIKFLSRKAKIDLIALGYVENGIMKSHSLEASGEVHFIKKELSKHLNTDTPVFFDVGANLGDYTSLLAESFPQSQLFSFEPNPNTFEQLEKRCDSVAKLFNIGIGEQAGNLELFFDASNKTSVQATSDKKILEVIAKAEDITSVNISIDTLDQFCEAHKIEFIHLLKIDTEGFELEALTGAKNLLSQNKIGVIQFEFNEINIVKRRFLKDFYDMLPGYNFYRLDEHDLIPLKEWQPKHEIFMFQNIVAFPK
ncbi:MAG: FkbM family methyltransferase [Crocinitomicaceae bacterium]